MSDPLPLRTITVETPRGNRWTFTVAAATHQQGVNAAHAAANALDCHARIYSAERPRPETLEAPRGS